MVDELKGRIRRLMKFGMTFAMRTITMGRINIQRAREGTVAFFYVQYMYKVIDRSEGCEKDLGWSGLFGRVKMET